MSAARYALPGAALLLLASGPLWLSEFNVTLMNYIGLYAIVALGLVLLTGVGGLTSFGQAAFVGLGAYTSAWLSTAHAVSPWLGLLAGLALTLVFALALGFITLRLSGHFLPLGTIAWGISLYFLFGNLEMLGGHTGITGIPGIPLPGYEIRDGRDFYLLIWLMLILMLVATRNLLDSREGRSIRALKGGAVMAEAMGVDTARAKILIFTIAALFAAVSGWLYVHLQRFVNPTPFSLNQGIEYLFMAVIGGVAHVWGAIAGAAVITILKQWLQDLLPQLLGSSGNFEVTVFGLMMIYVLHRAREGLWPIVLPLCAPWLARCLPASAGASPGAANMANVANAADAADAALTAPAAPASLPQRPRPAPGSVLLEVIETSKRFGGLVANNAMSLDVRAGEVMALIGPNGAGKSTMFNCISGVDPVSSGQIRFLGERIDALPSRAIARRGMSRTFQHVRLLPTMSVLENVAIGAHLRGCSGFVAAALRLDRAEEARLLAEAAHQIARVGLGEHVHDAVGSLPLGKQRIVEIARALAADPCLLLLDEPAAGLRYLEKQALAELLSRLRSEGMGILLVEHDMDFVMGLADRVVVMEFGEKLAAGLPHDIQKDPKVLQAYLGDVE